MEFNTNEWVVWGRKAFVKLVNCLIQRNMLKIFGANQVKNEWMEVYRTQILIKANTEMKWIGWHSL